MECNLTSLASEEIMTQCVICICLIMSPIIHLLKPMPYVLLRMHTYILRVFLILMFCVRVSLCRSSDSKMQAEWLKVKKQRFYWLLSVYSCFVWIRIATPQLEGLVCAELSLIKEVFDGFSASVWKLSLCMERGWLVPCCSRWKCVCVYRRRDSGTESEKRALTANVLSRGLWLFALHFKTEHYQVSGMP